MFYKICEIPVFANFRYVEILLYVMFYGTLVLRIKMFLRWRNSFEQGPSEIAVSIPHFLRVFRFPVTGKKPPTLTLGDFSSRV